MKTLNFFLVTILVGTLLLSNCATPTEIPETQTPSPTVKPSPALPLEKNVALNKPVRVSAYWIVDPPQRAVNGSFNDWWGAGGPPPQWIEVNLEGIYTVSRIRVVNQGPTGTIPYQVIGRDWNNQTRLLHTFEGYKSANQVLEYIPETAWEDITAIRIEINSGFEWTGLREIQVFSREDPESLPVSTKPSTPLYLSGVQADSLEPITPENAFLVKSLAILGRGSINQLAWSADDKTIAAAGTLGVWLYDPAALDAVPLLLEGHTRDVLGVAFGQDGEMVFSGSQDGTVRQWEVASGKLVRTIPLFTDFSYEVGEQKRNPEIWSMAFSPDGNLLAAGAYDGKIHLWDLTTGKELTVLLGHSGFVQSLAFSPDGTLLVSNNLKDGIFVWDVAKRSKRDVITVDGIVGRMAFSPDGKTLAYAGIQMNVHLWDILGMKESAELLEHGNVLSLTFSRDSLTLATGSIDGKLRLWDVKTEKTRILSDRAGWITGMTFNSKGTKLSSYSFDGVFHLWDTATGEESVVTSHTSPVNSIAFSPDGKSLATGLDDGYIRIWDIETNKLQAVLGGHTNSVTSVAFSPDGNMIASGSLDKTVRLWDVKTAMQVAVLPGHKSYVRCVSFSPDGSLVASGSTDLTIRLVDLKTMKEKAVLEGHTGEVESLAFSPDGKWLVSASADTVLRLWEVATGKLSGVLKDHKSFIITTTFSPDGTLLVSGGGDHSLHVWDWKVESGKLVAQHHFPPVGHGGWVLSATVSPDGKMVASANVSTTSYYVAPGEIHLYSSADGYPLALLTGHIKRISSVAFSPDGRILASGSADGSVRLWGVEGNVD